jgi:hypothetical protein
MAKNRSTDAKTTLVADLNNNQRDVVRLDHRAADIPTRLRNEATIAALDSCTCELDMIRSGLELLLELPRIMV